MRIRKIHLAFSLILMTVSTICKGQEDIPEKDASINSNRKYKSEVGIDLSAFNFIMNSPSGGYPSFFYRRHFNKSKPVKGLSGINKTTFHAYRIRVGSNLSFEKITPPDIRDEFYNNNFYSYYYNNTINSSFFIRAGKEKQIRSTRFELFYGYDLFLEYDKIKELWIRNWGYNYSQPDQYFINEQWGTNIRTLKFGIAGVGGFKFFLIPRLCFSAEASLDIGYSKKIRENFYDNYNSSTDLQDKDRQIVKVSGIQSNFNPLFVINMGYYFK